MDEYIQADMRQHNDRVAALEAHLLSLLSAVKSFAIHGRGQLRSWFDAYRKRSNYMKAVSAMSRRIAEGLWWVMVKGEPYKYWQGQPPHDGAEMVERGSLVISATTGGVLAELEPEPSPTQ